MTTDAVMEPIAVQQAVMQACTIRAAIARAQEIGQGLEGTVQTLNEILEAEAEFKRRYDELKRQQEVIEAELTFNADQAKDGPLAGLAKTSPVYKAALTTVLERSPEMTAHAKKLRNARIDWDRAVMERDQFINRMTALKYQANLQTAILEAMTWPKVVDMG